MYKIVGHKSFKNKIDLSVYKNESTLKSLKLTITKQEKVYKVNTNWL